MLPCWRSDICTVHPLFVPKRKNGKPPASVLPVDSVLPERLHMSERMSTRVVLCLLTLILSSLVGPGRADNQPSTKRPGAVRRDGRARAAKKIEAASKVLSPTGDVGGGGQLGSGAEYLEQTETEWDGKTPWFTGSCKWKCGVRIPAFWVSGTTVPAIIECSGLLDSRLTNDAVFFP
jgi:hypothetical protein